MRVVHAGVPFELDDEWWAEAGMTGFSPTREAFRGDRSAFPELEMFELPVVEVGPVKRTLTHGMFNDSPVEGTARHRVTRILKGFREDSAIPPVEVVRTPQGPFHFALYHGAHRFCCAIAAGFTAVPAVDVTNRPGQMIDLDKVRGGRTRRCS